MQSAVGLQPQSRIISADEVLRGADAVVLEHAGRQYRLRVARNGRLTMRDPQHWSPRWWVGVAVLLLSGYVAGAPVIIGISSMVYPAADPVLEWVYAPIIPLYENIRPYEQYCDWCIEQTQAQF